MLDQVQSASNVVVGVGIRGVELAPGLGTSNRLGHLRERSAPGEEPVMEAREGQACLRDGGRAHTDHGPHPCRLGKNDVRARGGGVCVKIHRRSKGKDRD
jgi:hypothetical protein